ncbi:hypothetical protein AtDm6_2638 [Acetobacter tropicalis]|uniref:Uncharacterized protein n=1 Tax=Acetobacter tropicalis TaxID=104102 RepID=A0A094YJC1_9PROT|nr:hypothetical protein AtDm6_2638 [Acetobacter tropicalis]
MGSIFSLAWALQPRQGHAQIFLAIFENNQVFQTLGPD